MKAIRYNEKTYVMKGYFERNVFMKLLEVGVTYKGYGRFYVPVELKEKVNDIIPVDFVDEVMDWIHYGYYQEDMAKKSLFAIQDLNGSYLYVLDPELASSAIKRITQIPYFFINYSQIKRFQTKLDRKLYIEDYISNTDLNIENPELKALLYSQKDGFYTHNIVNRICLHKYSEEKG